MAAAIEVVHGPARGWKYLLGRAEVRVGRGAGHQMKLDDPSWGVGYLGVRYRRGGHVVANRMGHAVLLDGRPLADGEEATWFTGVTLQPTGGTLLRLAAADGPEAAEADAGMVAADPDRAEAARAKRSRNWLALGLVLVAAAGLGAKEASRARPVPPGEVLLTQLRPRLIEVYPDRRGAELATAIQHGMVCRSKGDAAGAKQKYREARTCISSMAAGPGSAGQRAGPLQDALRFVADREQELGGG